MKNLAFVALLALILFPRCSKNASDYNLVQNPDVEEKNNFSSASGQELFKSIFFLEGKFSQNISALRDSRKALREAIEANDVSSEVLNLMQDIQNEIIDDIISAQPDFFEVFEENLKSGNPVLVRSGLIMGGQALTKMLSNNSVYLETMSVSLMETAESLDLELDFQEYIRNDGTIDADLLTKAVSNMVAQTKNGYSNSSNTMKNFGMRQGANNIAIAASVVAAVVAVVALAAVQTVVAGVNYALAANVAAAINVAGAVNFAVAVNITMISENDYDGETLIGPGPNSAPTGGGGGGCASLRIETGISGVDENGKPIFESAMKAVHCASNESATIATDIMVIEVMNLLEQE